MHPQQKWGNWRISHISKLIFCNFAVLGAVEDIIFDQKYLNTFSHAYTAFKNYC